ncbi:MAG: rRNA maturation RNase YbeY [Dehalococcoidia bacterium]|nr:rRNA maturation RNase YbeY [Dehalococcoidia bacterium]
MFDTGFDAVLDRNWLQMLAETALKCENQSAAEMGIFITGQEQIRRLHNEYMGEDSVTDVLSFAMNEGDVDTHEFVLPIDGKRHLGEVIISFPQAEKQAAEQGHTTEREITVLLLHGILHLLGYDHDETVRQQRMQLREKHILKIIEENLP